MRLDDTVARTPELVGKQPEEDVLHTRVLSLEEREVVPEHRPRLALLECGDRRRARRAGKEQRELAERLARTEHVEEHAVAVRALEPGGEAPARDEMQRVGGVVTVEDHLALRERPPAGDREQLAYVLFRKPLEQWPLHGRSLCDGRDIRNVARAHDTKPTGA